MCVFLYYICIEREREIRRPKPIFRRQLADSDEIPHVVVSTYIDICALIYICTYIYIRIYI